MNRFACDGSASGPFPGKVAAWVIAAVVAQVMLAPAAWAITATLSTNQGPPGTHVTVRITDLQIPCEVRFDDLLVVGEAGCQPSADGSVSPSFSVPAEATTGYHQVSVTARRPGSSSQLSNSFRVTASRPRSSSSNTPGSSASPASPSDKASPSPSPSPTPSPASSPSPSPEGSPTAGSMSESPTATGSGVDAGASSDSGVETDSAIPVSVIALVAVGVGLTVAAAIYALLTRRGSG